MYHAYWNVSDRHVRSSLYFHVHSVARMYDRPIYAPAIPISDMSRFSTDQGLYLGARAQPVPYNFAMAELASNVNPGMC